MVERTARIWAVMVMAIGLLAAPAAAGATAQTTSRQHTGADKLCSGFDAGSADALGAEVGAELDGPAAGELDANDRADGVEVGAFHARADGDPRGERGVDARLVLENLDGWHVAAARAG